MKFTVLDPTVPMGIVLDHTGTVVIDKREPLTLGYSLLPDYAVSGVKWKSSDKKVARVANGVVTPKTTGITTITATTVRGKEKAKVKIKVVDKHAPKRVSIVQGPSATIQAGSTLQLEATAVTAYEGYEPITTYRWKSSDRKVAVVDRKTGLVTARKVGTAKITVKTRNKKKAVITINVVNP